MVKQDFFLLRDPLTRGAFGGRTTTSDAFDLMYCAFRGEVVPESPIAVIHGEGRTMKDLVWVSVVKLLVAQRVVEAMSEAQLTGWSTYPVEVSGRHDEPIHGYHGFAVTGRCSALLNDRDHSEVVYRDYPGGRFPQYRGMYVEGWDGSDFFLTEGKGFVVLSEKAAGVFRRAKVTNVELQPVSEFEYRADDQPSFPKLRPPDAPAPKSTLTVEALSEGERSEITELADAARSRLGVSAEEDAARVVARILRYVEQTRPLEDEELVEQALELGCLWGELVAGGGRGWEWVALHGPEGDGVMYGVVDADRAYAVEPVRYFHEVLASDERENNVLLLFNMIVAQRLPASPKYGLLLLG